MIDLHLHSTFSDGSFTPEELVAKGCEAGLAAMALTDHDCLDGVGRFMTACAESGKSGYRDGQGLHGIAGVEISANVPKGTLHMLGYHVQPGNERIEASLSHIRDGRSYRNELMLKQLNQMGLELTWEEIAAYAGEDIVGRPHFAMAMLARGYISNKQEAFDKYLGKGAKAYADRFRLSPEDSMAMISDSGGVPVLSHPFTLEMDSGELRKFVGDLAQKGLRGIEVYYSEHNRRQVAEYLKLAQEFNLVATGGSDFHGAVNPDVRLGVGFGGLRVPDSIVEQLAQARPTE